MSFEISEEEIMDGRRQGLTVEQILISIMTEKYNMSARQVGDLLLVSPQCVRSVYISARIKR